jgi:hypothetical protein
MKIKTTVELLIYLDAMVAAVLKGGSNDVPPPLHVRAVFICDELLF